MALIEGVYPVVSTPFGADGALLPDELDRLIAYSARAGAHGVVYPAIASEFATLTEAERSEASNIVIQAAAREGIGVIVGISAEKPCVSRSLAAMADDGGARGVMLMVPKSAGSRAEDVAHFVTEATAGLKLEIVLQNAPPPLGSSLPTDILSEAMRRTPWVRYIKEEIVPCGQRMTRLMEALGPGLDGILGGAGGRFVLDEYARGACGTMPSCEMVELHRRIWDLVQANQFHEARQIFRLMLPLLDMAAVFRQSVVKEVLVQRGLLTCARIRDENFSLDAQDRREIEINLSQLLPLFETGQAEETRA